MEKDESERKKDGDGRGAGNKHESLEETRSTREEERGRHWWLGQFERQRSSFYISHPGAPRTAGGRRQGGGVEEVCVVWVVLLKGERWGDTL